MRRAAPPAAVRAQQDRQTSQGGTSPAGESPEAEGGGLRSLASKALSLGDPGMRVIR